MTTCTRGCYSHRIYSHSCDRKVKTLTSSSNSSLGYSCTRGRNNIHLERPNTDFYRKSFEFRGATMWNQLPNSVKDLSSNTTFKCTIKNTFLGL